MQNDAHDSTRRRLLLGAAGGAAVATTLGAVHSAAASRRSWDREADIVCVGSGAAGLTAAVIAASLGNRVMVLAPMGSPHVSP